MHDALGSQPDSFVNDYFGVSAGSQVHYIRMFEGLLLSSKHLFSLFGEQKLGFKICRIQGTSMRQFFVFPVTGLSLICLRSLDAIMVVVKRKEQS